MWLAVVFVQAMAMATAASEPDCEEEILNGCVDHVMKVLNQEPASLLHFRDDNHRQYCKYGALTTSTLHDAAAFSDGIKCMDNYTQNCLEEDGREVFARMYPGPRIVYSFLCFHESFRKEFLTHSKCYEAIYPKILVCLKDSESQPISANSTQPSCWAGGEKNDTESSRRKSSVTSTGKQRRCEAEDGEAVGLASSRRAAIASAAKGIGSERIKFSRDCLDIRSFCNAMT
ncbi:unnamed protein product [Darwinula stevensoni]|uniref:Secreted protein n=1 Tax=Darwinula stevensoni TaxID=69355 RepID=A0A7R9FN78_9CRUS|nr:unnamed protein product [Darwinula stevensoni]CAG0896394.1 unnamed protein product [Darwinula stevensoni]